MNTRIISIALLILFAIASRFVPHPPNFTPIIGVGLFAGAYISRRIWAFIVPLLILLISDVVLGFHTTMIWVYGSIILIVAIGILLSKKSKITSIIGGSISGSVLFYIVTNFGVWITGGGFAHPLSFQGLMLCYIDAIPFFQNTLSSTVLYSGILFGAYEILCRVVPALQLTKPVNE